MKTKVKIFIMSAILSMFLVSGCVKEIGRQFVDIAKVDTTISKEFSQANVKTTIYNDSYLTIDLINSDFNALSKGDQKKKAREIAEAAIPELGKSTKIKAITVIFTISETKFLFITFNDSTAAYQFNISDLQKRHG